MTWKQTIGRIVIGAVTGAISTIIALWIRDKWRAKKKEKEDPDQKADSEGSGQIGDKDGVQKFAENPYTRDTDPHRL